MSRLYTFLIKACKPEALTSKDLFGKNTVPFGLMDFDESSWPGPEPFRSAAGAGIRSDPDT